MQNGLIHATMVSTILVFLTELAWIAATSMPWKWLEIVFCGQAFLPLLLQPFGPCREHFNSHPQNRLQIPHAGATWCIT